MALMDILAKSQGGTYFANVAAVTGLSAAEAKAAMAAIGPAVAAQLKRKIAADSTVLENLLELLEDGGHAADLDDREAMTGSEAVADGNAILASIYGSRNVAIVDMRKRASDIAEGQLEKLSAITATSVLAALAKSHGAAMPLAGQPVADGDRGLFGTLVSAIVKGALDSAVRQLAPRRRKRRAYSSYFGARRRKITRRKRKPASALEDIFAEILGTRRR